MSMAREMRRVRLPWMSKSSMSDTQAYNSAALLQALEATSEAIIRTLDPMLIAAEGLESRVVECMRYGVFNGGKRLRPLLVLASSELFNVAQPLALRTAAAIECIHCYSLIHDDLPAMDDDDLRRGKPTAHIAYDEATAILAGDALQSLAFEILSCDRTHSDPNVRIELVRSLAVASGHKGMVGGQMIDISADPASIEENEVYRLQQLKTGMLISFACEAGAILGKASDQARTSLRLYARDLGLAFQIVDDLLDIEGDEEHLGKAVQKDKEAGKATLVDFMGVEKSRQQARSLADQAISHLSSFDEKATLLRAIAHFVINRQS